MWSSLLELQALFIQQCWSMKNKNKEMHVLETLKLASILKKDQFNPIPLKFFRFQKNIQIKFSLFLTVKSTKQKLCLENTGFVLCQRVHIQLVNCNIKKCFGLISTWDWRVLPNYLNSIHGNTELYYYHAIMSSCGHKNSKNPVSIYFKYLLVTPLENITFFQKACKYFNSLKLMVWEICICADGFLYQNIWVETEISDFW